MRKIRRNLSTRGSSPPSDNYECPYCLDREFIIRGNTAYPCRCRESKTINRLIKSSGITKGQRRVTLNQFVPGKATAEMHRMAVQYVKEFTDIAASDAENKGLGLMGSVGVGKTHILLGIANALLNRRVPVVMVNTPELIGELYDAQFSRDEEGLNAKIYKLGTARVVIFDDVGKEKITDWVQVQYYRIINQRYARRLPTIFSSNLTMDEIAEKIGDASASRLYALTRGRQVYVNAVDYRLAGR